MAQNFIQKGEVITLIAEAIHKSGNPYRIHGFNGVALISVEPGEKLSFQLEGIFEFALADISVGELIGITQDNQLYRVMECDDPKNPIFGRAVTASDANSKFYCRLLQSD